MAHIQFKIVTPERIVFEDTVDAIILPTIEGEITVLPHHIPLVSLLKAGVLRIQKGKEETPLAVSSGVIEVDGERVVVLADTAERADDLDEAKIEKAREEARQLMESKRRGDREGFAEASALLERELARLKVVKRYRHGRAGPKPT
ncbi:MAG: ATP synthase F1 subunit epsilon [Patescibacteria group bacterium]